MKARIEELGRGQANNLTETLRYLTNLPDDAHTRERIQAALNELKRTAGRQFDARLVDASVDFIQREFWKHNNFEAFLAEGANGLEYIRARTRIEALIANGGSQAHL